MYMDLNDFKAAQNIVRKLCDCLDTMDEKMTHPNPWRAIRGDLTDFLIHIYHHTLGGYTIATDLDFVEVRDNKIAALIELKKRGRRPSATQKLVLGTISKALNVPYYLLSHNYHYTKFYITREDGNELHLDRVGFHQFMQEFQVPIGALLIKNENMR